MDEKVGSLPSCWRSNKINKKGKPVTFEEMYQAKCVSSNVRGSLAAAHIQVDAGSNNRHHFLL